MSDYNYFIIRNFILDWYEKIKLKENMKILLSKNNDKVLIFDIEFKNCMAQLSVTDSLYNPYRFIYFESIDFKTSKQIYCFYDNNEMVKCDVIKALDKAIEYCLKY